jgi:hypothetical protein
MQTLNDVNESTPRSFGDCLQQLRSSPDMDVATIPNINEWMQYWNDEESYAANLRNIRHWIARVTHKN